MDGHAEPEHIDANGRTWKAILAKPKRNRVDLDVYFMRIARETAARGTCDRKQVAAVLVRDSRIIATGYNGAPSKWPDCDVSGHELVKMGERESCTRTIHAEQNAIIQCAREAVRSVGTTCYVTAQPCYECAKFLAQAGVVRIVYGEEYMSARSGDRNVINLLQDAGIQTLFLPNF